VGDVLAQSIAGWYASRDQPQQQPKQKQKQGGGKAGSTSNSSSSNNSYDACRTLRMAGFGLFFYGPYQYYWYSLLEHLMPARTAANFVCKVAANQLLLAPVTLTVAFAWHLAFSSPPSSSASPSPAAAAGPSAGSKGGNGSSSKGGGTKAAPSSPQPAAAAAAGAASCASSLLASVGGGKLAPLPAKMQADFVPALLTGWKFWVPAASVNFWAVPLRQQVLYMSCCGVLWTAYLSHASGNKLSPPAEPAPAAAAGGRKRR
jgi:hypothetical protein